MRSSDDPNRSLPSYIVHEDDVQEEPGHYPAPFDAETLSSTRDLGLATGTVNFGVRQERIPPGLRTSFTHAHSVEEEWAYVLKGECAVRIVDPDGTVREHALRAGHAVAFPAGTGIAHTFINRGTKDCLLLCVGERKDDSDRVFYPEAQDRPYNEHMEKDRPERFWKR